MRTSLLLIAALVLLACGEDDAAGDDGLFECMEGRDGWEQCVDGVVQWCHVTPDDSHFHAGRNCAQDGLVCATLDNLGYCADPETTCDASAPGMCDGREALNCVDGVIGARRCGVGTECAVNADGLAVCEAL